MAVFNKRALQKPYDLDTNSPNHTFICNSDPNEETSALHLNNLEERSSLSSFTIRVQPTVEEFDEDSPGMQ